MRKILLIPFILMSCQQELKVQPEVMPAVDSILTKSIKTSDSSVVALKIADKKTEQVVKQVAKKVEAMKLQIEVLKIMVKNPKSIIVRDTVFITEKKNFWGKTRKTIDSTLKDSTEYEKDF